MQKKLLVVLVIGIFVFGMAGMANAIPMLVDNFNDGITSGWTVQNGSVIETGGTISGSNLSLITLNGYTGNSIGVDAISNPGIDYIALVLNYNSLSDNLFVKIQDNNSNGLFDRVFFYHGNNGGSSVTGTYYFDLDFEVQSTYFEVTNNGDGTVSAIVGATGDVFGGTLKNIYTGTGIGLGFYGPGEADNFYVETFAPVPEPATMLLFVSGFAVLFGLGIRRKKDEA